MRFICVTVYLYMHVCVCARTYVEGDHSTLTRCRQRQDRANMQEKICLCAGGIFEVINLRSGGALFGAFRVSDSGMVGAPGSSYALNVELRHQGKLLGCRKVLILSVTHTVLTKVGARVKDYARSNSRMWGRTKLQTYEEVEGVVSDLEANNGRFANNPLYTWTAAEKAGSKQLENHWKDAISLLGGLGRAHYDPDGILDAAMLDRIKTVLLKAFIKLGAAVPLDARDYMSPADFDALEDKWLIDFCVVY